MELQWATNITQIEKLSIISYYFCITFLNTSSKITNIEILIYTRLTISTYVVYSRLVDHQYIHPGRCI
jgi:hypothetical protein